MIIYATLGGIKGVIWADFFQYSIAMFGAVYAAIIAIRQPEIGSLKALLSHPNVSDKIAILGKNDVAKTALFEILAGELEPDAGKIEWGVTVTKSYFPSDNTKYFQTKIILLLEIFYSIITNLQICVCFFR